MEKTLVADEEFNGVDFNQKSAKGTDFENCQFLNCSFASADLTDTCFSECEFDACDLSSAKITNTAFKDVSFCDCKLLGLKFESCNKFLLEFRFEGCQIDYTTFYQLKLPKTEFKNCSLKEADFTETDFSGSRFKIATLAEQYLKMLNWKRQTSEQQRITASTLKKTEWQNHDFRKMV